MYASMSSTPTPAVTPASAIEKETPVLKSTGLLGYPALRHWPELAPAIAVHTNLGLKRQWARLRVPVKLMREAGMHPERGVQVATHGNRVLIWGDARGGQFQQCAESKGFPLFRNYGVPKRITNRTMAVVQGPDYLIVTTMTDALKLAAQVEVHEHEMWRRMGLGIVSALKNELSPNGIDVRGWSDFTLCLTRPGAVSRTASVAGPVWWLAGFVAGDAIRFTRYRNATVVEKCTEDARHSVLVKERNSERPRHYVGSLLCDIANTDKIRAIALPGRLILTTPETNIGRLCDGTPQRLTLKELLLSYAHDARQEMPAIPLVQPTIDIDTEPRAITGNPSTLAVFPPSDVGPLSSRKTCSSPVSRRAARTSTKNRRKVHSDIPLSTPRQAKPMNSSSLPLPQFDSRTAEILLWRDYAVEDGKRGVSVAGALWATAGFEKGSPIRICQYSNGVAVEAATPDRAERSLGAPSAPQPYHLFMLKRFGLAGHRTVRVVVMRGRVLLTRIDSDIGLRCSALQSVPSGLGQRLFKPVKPDTEVGSYPVPEGRRLQMQGKWLRQFGFAPGLKYRVVPMESELQLELVGDGGMTVTEHSPGRAKLYVPTETLKPLSCPSVKVLAGEGRIRLVPATA